MSRPEVHKLSGNDDDMAEPAPRSGSTATVEVSSPLSMVLQTLQDMRSTQAASTARIERTMDEKLTQFRQELFDKQEVSYERLEKKLKTGKEKYAFKRKAKHQHKFNDDVLDKSMKLRSTWRRMMLLAL